MARADGAEQRRAFLAGGGVGAEVHVLDDQVDRVLFEQRQSLLRRGGAQRVDVVQRQQHFQRDGDGGIVVDDEYGRHRVSITLSASIASGAARGQRRRGAGGAPRRAVHG